MATGTHLDLSPLKPSVSISPTLSKNSDSDCDVYSLSSSVITSVEEGEDGHEKSSSFLDNSSAEHWASLLRESYNALSGGALLDAECLKAPRRRHVGTLRLGESGELIPRVV